MIKQKTMSVLSVCALFAAGCNGEYSKEISGKYCLIRTNFREVVIERPHSFERDKLIYEDPKRGVQVNGNVKQFALNPPFVTGYAEAFVVDGKKWGSSKTGYFILNSKTDEINEGLTQEQWIKELRKIGWKEPKLEKPPYQ